MKRIIQALTTVVFGLALFTAVHGATFVVNTTNDTADVTPGDGNCADAGAQCSLRAAISEANALAGADIITLGAVAYTLSRQHVFVPKGAASPREDSPAKP